MASCELNLPCARMCFAFRYFICTFEEADLPESRGAFLQEVFGCGAEAVSAEIAHMFSQDACGRMRHTRRVHTT